MLNKIPQIGYIDLSLDSPPRSSFERFLMALDGQMSEPKCYGWFHLLCILLTVAGCVFVSLKCRNLSDRRVRATVGCTAALLILLEIYKQLNFAYDSETGEWSYAWSAFPFQFCSTPMYVMAAAAFCKKGKLQTKLYEFLSTYGLFAGLLVMLYPASVFTETIGINIQTMIHHGMMIVIGVFLYASGRVRIERRTVWRAAPVFLVLFLAALLMNGVYAVCGDPEQNFNMFYLSPRGSAPVGFIDVLFDVIPYPIILTGYAAGFTFAGFLTTMAARLCVSLYRRHVGRKKPVEETTMAATEESKRI